MEKQKRQTDRDIANVEHIITASAAYQALMSGCLETIDAFIARGSLAEGLPQ